MKKYGFEVSSSVMTSLLTSIIDSKVIRTDTQREQTSGKVDWFEF